MDNVYHILGQHAHWNVNKQLAKIVGIEAAILLADLVSKRQYFIENKDVSDGWFFNTQENIEIDTTLTPHQQRKCIDILVEKGLLETDRKTVGAKNRFKILDIQILNILISRSEKSEYLEVKKVNISYNKNKEIRINNNIDTTVFDKFWEMYGKKVGDKQMCLRKWNKLTEAEINKIFETLPTFVSGFKDKQYQPFPLTYLNQKRWNDELQQSTTVKKMIR